MSTLCPYISIRMWEESQGEENCGAREEESSSMEVSV